MVSTFDCFSILLSCAIIQSYWTLGCCLKVQHSSTLGPQHFFHAQSTSTHANCHSIATHYCRITLCTQFGQDSTAKRRRLRPSRARASQLFSTTEPPFTRKNAMFRANPNILHDVAVPMRSANNDLQNTIRIVTSLLYLFVPHSTFLNSTLQYSTYTQLLLYHYLYLYPYRFYSALLYSPLLYSTLLYSALLCSALLSSTLPLLFSTLPSSLSTSTLPLRRCRLDTMISGRVRM